MSESSPAALSGRRVLVTGGAGFIGRHVVAALSSVGARPRVLDLRPHPDPAVDAVEGDLADPDVLAAGLRGASTRSCTSRR